MSKVRVLRVLEYEYSDLDRAIADQKKWAVKESYTVPGGWLTIRSSVIGGLFGFTTIEEGVSE